MSFGKGLSKLIIQCSAHRKTASKLLDKIEDAKKNEKLTEFDKILENLEANEKILLQDVSLDGIQALLPLIPVQGELRV